MPFGVDYLWDIQRLAAAHGLTIRCAFDIGANAGDTAAEFLGAFPNAQVHSFEPHPNVFSILAKIKSDRLHAHPLAISNKVGPADFFVYSKGGTFGRVTDTNSIKVQCQTVDQFCADHQIGSLDLLKTDTEGHEVEVLDGARDTLLHRCVRFVFVEFRNILPIASTSYVLTGLTPIAERLEPLGFRFMASYPVHMTHEPLQATLNALYFRP